MNSAIKTVFECSPGTCSPPFAFVAGGCYEFLSIGVSWDDARTVCQNSGADLAIVNDCSVMAELISYASAAGIWLALH